MADNKIPMKVIQPTAAEVSARQAVMAAIKPHADALGADRMLAVLSYTVGQLVGLQDQRKMTGAMAMAIVLENIEAGNMQMIQGLSMKTEERA